VVTKSSAKTGFGKAGAGAPAADSTAKEALGRYRAKRDPAVTTEPFSAERVPKDRKTATGAFVVHCHDARRRHWDVRVEVGGELASFAVPRGPTFDPSERRLAVHTEDHPIEYLDFEDVIPDGNYGAGAMIVWDLGRIVYLEPAEEGLEKGKLDFLLYGHKLRGRFAFVRTGNRKGKSPEEKDQWLLIKKADAFADPKSDIVVDEPRSILSGLTVEELYRKREIADEVEADAKKLGATVGSVDARRMVPMLCSITEVPLDDPSRLYELKMDGVRLLAERRGDDVALVYRSQRVMTTTYPEVARAMRALAPERVVVDGEVVAFDDEGRPSFQRLGRRMHLTRPHDVMHAASEVPVVFVVFDLLQIGDLDLRKLPLKSRKELLGRIVPRRGVIRLLDHLEGDGRPIYELCKTVGLEGIVAKKANSHYRPGPERSEDWVKIKRDREADFVVVGWVDGKGGRKSLGALEIASYVGDRLVLRGRVGSGLDDRTITDLVSRLKPIEVDEPVAEGEPFRPTGDRHFVKPELVVNVKFTGFTDDGGVRHPVFNGLRPDISPADCVAAPQSEGAAEPTPEPPDSAPAPTPSSPPPAAEKPTVYGTNRSKIFWPDEGYTKGDMLDYYAAVAPAILRFLRRRPIVLVRYPDGITGKSFYQWNVPVGTPDWIRTLNLPDDDGDGDGKNTFLVDDVRALMHVINLGCIPVHALPYREQSPEDSDYFVVDFDLGTHPFSDAVTLALALRELLEEIGLEGFPKTSGQSGFHVLVPLGPGISHDTSKMLVELVGRLLQARHHELSTLERRIAARKDRVFIDTGQTGRSRTIVAPYSVRAHAGATVSMPVRWDDVHRALDPKQFTMFTAPERLAERGDPLADFFDKRPNIPEVVARLGKKLGQAP
jgi:bifunctional non-homologous end joining protein LigD